MTTKLLGMVFSRYRFPRLGVFRVSGFPGRRRQPETQARLAPIFCYLFIVVLLPKVKFITYQAFKFP